MPNRRHNKQVPGFKIGGRVAKMKGGSMNGKPISKSKNVGLAKMIESPKGKEAAKACFELIKIKNYSNKVDKN